ncbi:MAG: repair protein SbcC/Rad50 [Thermococcaceae archaeon]|uniref:AAA family ATPase n=1 Tax=Pyrococcus sp. TaxID=33866 RepID=UPI00258D1FEA|nr:AAA family ATPase [Pyrococcus sp.]MDK2783493.1 repair protein SbcC/Rad50 [Thermococcaceae archaeon]MDK2870356.1 repair protein SbcC/Rad50 [Pyrococcus sp.]MDK2983708.1 repair protein SbcC/Rad50 [Thermococcaceae archaeon]
MIIRHIVLKDFLSHKDTTVDFPFGVTVFVGPNGAGKTSILDGIFVALFNHRPRGENWSDVIRRGATSARIELEFEEGGIPYYIVWERRKTGVPIYKLYRADTNTLIAEGVREVQLQLERIIGLDKDSAINSILIRQGEITSLLDQRPAERKNLIGRLIGLNRLETAWRNMAAVIDHFKDKLREYERLQGEYDYLTKHLEELTIEQQKLQGEIQNLKGQMKLKEEDLARFTKLLQEMEKKKEKYTEISNEINLLNTQLERFLDNLNTALKELKEAEEAKKRAEELLPEVSKLETLEGLLRVINQIKPLKEQRETLERELSRIEQIEQTINETAPLHEEYMQIEETLKSIEASISDLQPRKETLISLEKEKELVLNELEKARRKLNEILEKTKAYQTVDKIDETLLLKTPDELEREITKLQTTIENYASTLERLRLELKESENARNRVKELEPLIERLSMLKELRELQSQISETKREMERIREILSSIAELREAIEKLLPSHGEYQRITNELERLHEELDKLREKLGHLNAIEGRLKEKETQLHRLEKELEELEREILKFLPTPTLEAKEEQLNNLVKTIRETQRELKRYQDRIAALRGRIGEIEEYLSLLEGSSVCPVCHREMDETHKARVKREFLDERNQIEEEIHKLEKLSKELEEKLGELENIRRSLEKLDLARYQKMKAEMEELKNEIENMREQLSEKNKLENEYIDLMRKINEKEEHKKIVEQDYHKYSVLKEQLENILQQTPEHELEGKLSKLQAQLSLLNNQVAQIESALKEIPSNLNEEIKKLEKLQEEYLSLKPKAEELESIKKEISTIEESLRRTKEVEIPSRLLAEKLLIEKEVEKLSKKLADLEDKIDVTKRDVERLNELEDKKKQLRSRLEELKPAHEKYVGSVDALKRERPKNEVIRDIEVVSQELLELTRRTEELANSIGGIPDDLEAEISRLRNLKDEYIRASERAKELQSLQEKVSHLNSEVERLKASIELKKQELKSLDFSEEELKSLQEKVRSIENTVKELNGVINAKEEELRKILSKIEEVKTQISELEQKLKKVERLQRLLSDLERIRAAYHRDGVQRLLRQRIAPVISELATDYIENFNMDITDIYLSEDFDITVVKNSVEVPTSTLSGGERVAVALALRLAIARALSRNLSVIIMDEPTTHLDEERRKDLVEILDRFFKSRGAIPQVIIVTHHPELENVADTLYLVRNVDGVSQVQEVENLGGERL